MPFINDVKADVAEQRALGRKTVLLNSGDFDASGIPIGEVFQRETSGCWDEIHRIALNPEQITRYGLERQRGKHLDPNVRAFVERFGPRSPSTIHSTRTSSTAASGICRRCRWRWTRSIPTICALCSPRRSSSR